MLNHFKRKLTKSAARGKGQIDMSQVRCLVERLEERTMLSASFGGPGYGYGGPDFVPPGGASPQRFGEPAAFASQQQQRPMSSQSQAYYDVREMVPADRSFQSHPALQSGFAPPTKFTEVAQLRSPDHGWSQFGAAPSYDIAYSYHPESEYSPYVSHVEAPPIHTVTVVVIEWYTNTRVTDPADGIPAMASGIKSGQPGAGGPPGSGFDPHPAIGQFNHNPYPGLYEVIGKFGDPNPYSGTSLNSVLANSGPTISDLPVASQILSRDTTTSTILNAVAREVAFQEFSPSLFQANATAAYDRVNADAIGVDAAPAELADGWIHPADESDVDTGANSSDAVARERAAVDAVLEKLEDVSKLSPAAASKDINSENNLQTETALDDLPAGEVDGGMVLLQATGDANTSGFDLTPVYAEHVGRFNMPAKMETSVGMIQAMDVASDDAPIIETVQQTDSPTPLNRESRLEDKLPTKREQSSTSKAATLVGVTTLTGALVWINRNGSRINRPKPTTQKHRAARS
jgi:hypothetical protein